MPSILRWFEHDGVRHRAWVRYDADATITNARPAALVVAGPGWEEVIDGIAAEDVDRLSPEVLTDLAERANARRRVGFQPGQPSS